MPGITRRALANPLLFSRASIHAGVGGFDNVAARCRDQIRCQRRPPQPQHYWNHQHQPQRSIASISTSAGNNILTASTTKFPAANEHLSPFFSCTGHRCSSGETTTTTTPQSQPLEQRRLKSKSSDPTAKRPTQKCDPYGLQGESLSYDQCLGLIATLDEGWELLQSENETIDATTNSNGNESTPKFLQKQYYHPTFSEASQFLSHIALLATNLNHFPHLSMERMLVDDLNNVLGENDNGKHTSSSTSSSNIGETSSTRKKGKIKGWIFRSTVRCSTYRPPTAGSSRPRIQTQKNDDKSSDLHGDKGLTFHDFHLAMSVDVEMGREEVKRLLWSDPAD